MKEFLSNKKTGWYVSAVACVLALVSLIVYAARGGNYLSPVSGLAVAFFVIGLVTNAVALFKDFKVLGFLPVVCYAIVLAVLLNSEMLFITNVAFGVDGNSIDGGFVTFLITEVLALILSIVSFTMGLSKSE